MNHLQILQTIFQHQTEVMAKYKEIEGLPDAPISLHTANGQRIIKDFAWRTCEELSEAWTDRYDTDKCGEELADALHFFVELLIFAGVTPEQIVEKHPEFPQCHLSGRIDIQVPFWNVVAPLGMACNQLRNRPWKRTIVPTNEGEFRGRLVGTFAQLMALWADLGYTEAEMLLLYERKNEIVKQRQREGY